MHKKSVQSGRNTSDPQSLRQRHVQWELCLAGSVLLHLFHALLELAHHFFHPGSILLILLTDWYTSPNAPGGTSPPFRSILGSLQFGTLKLSRKP
ncbi:hypothetical protein CsSME_00033592 [Camellia sinensis var. sinensis]